MKKKQRRGFALFVVVLLTAMLSVVAMSVLDLVRIDLLLAGHERTNDEAREVAEGALMEVINDEETPTLLPMLDDSDLAESYTPSTLSPFVRDSGARSYEASARLLRIVPMSESSHSFSRAIVHELESDADAGYGNASFRASTEVFRTVSFRPGIVLPRRHAR